MKMFSKSMLRILILGAVASLFAACGGAPGSTGVGSNGAESTPVISFTSNSESSLVLRGQGGVETSIVTFAVTDISGSPIRGRRVNFELSTNVGGVSFLGGSSADSSTSGLVSVIVQSGAFPVTAQVTATIAGTSTRAVSDEIAISTSTFSAASFPLTAVITTDVTAGVDAINVANGGVLAGTQVQLQMIVRDQFGHKVLDGSRITLASPETGLIEPSTCELSASVCSSTWTSTDSEGAGYRATIIAYANGAEEFLDINSNSVYDLGEVFTDLGEAYVDENEDGNYDLGEFFVDANRNGIYDAGGNGVWDGPCVSIDGESSEDEDARCAGTSSTIIWDTLVLQLN